MKTQYTVALSMLAGVALGAVSVGGLYAQGKAPGAYAIVTYTEIADPAAYKANVSDKTPAMIDKAGGHLLWPRMTSPYFVRVPHRSQSSE